MKNTYCTLFNYDYLAKGLALYRSMERTIEQFRLYVLAMDPETVGILRSLQMPKATILYYEDLMDAEMKSALEGRIGPSFFWTFTPRIIEYVISERGEDWCTYIDADCYFFKDPAEVFEIIEDGGYSIGIVEHRYRKDDDYGKWVGLDGRFNVAFNTFRNEENALNILREWKKQCIDCCTNTPTGESFGDQLYLNEWPDKYDRIYIVENDGIDVAPWNVNNYSVGCDSDSFVIRRDNDIFDVYMYHFHAISFLSKHLVSLNLWNPKPRRESRCLYKLYREYIAVLRDNMKLAELREDNRERKRNINTMLSKIKGRREKRVIDLFRNILII